MGEKINDIEQIFYAGNVQIEHIDDLVKYVERPCLSACQDLYRKNILTYWSSANKTSPNKAFILIRYDSLDDRNKEIVDDLLNKGIFFEDNGIHDSYNNSEDSYGKGICLSINTSTETEVKKVSLSLLKLANYLHYQDIKYNIYSSKYILSQSPFYTGKKVFGYPNLKISVCGEELSENYHPERKVIYDKIRMSTINNGTNIDMEKIAREIGWIYNPKDNLIYKDKETLKRHNDYIKHHSTNLNIKLNKKDNTFQ